MDLSTKPIVAFFVFKSEYGVLMKQRGKYLGLPGDYLKDNEDVIDCAHRALDRIAIVLKLDTHNHIGGSESYTWDNQPVAINIFDFREEDIVAPVHMDARYVDVNRTDIDFDITVHIYREILLTGRIFIAA